MGLGLFFSSLVMEQNGGALSLLSIEDGRDELFFPEEYCRATVAHSAAGTSGCYNDCYRVNGAKVWTPEVAPIFWSPVLGS